MTTKKKPTKKKPTKPAARPQARKKTAPMTRHVNDQADQATDNNDQAATALALELIAGDLPKTARALDGMSRDELREISRALTIECARLMQVESAHTELLRDLQEGAEDDDRRNEFRGKLPGGQLIVTDRRTGKFRNVSLEEWNQLPR